MFRVNLIYLISLYSYLLIQYSCIICIKVYIFQIKVNLKINNKVDLDEYCESDKSE